ncbi:hypothetical protein PtA15_4A663 [Puccinia triticina]|uniref:Uncharacterized protein n=1 Tax=Puccinia triticina TaxID=208348 RepID=A0ABY7CG62_9BASI|nr:uncharacterized protein PtA15_4A663 [Puccinia triticina]WAQ84211.1 hypothetical protein PtA15_4A663 [Puccinia triticina]WAR55037.1 hypothetical protein PtB15_4B656 [Puccinia triticina]
MSRCKEMEESGRQWGEDNNIWQSFESKLGPSTPLFVARLVAWTNSGSGLREDAECGQSSPSGDATQEEVSGHSKAEEGRERTYLKGKQMGVPKPVRPVVRREVKEEGMCVAKGVKDTQITKAGKQETVCLLAAESQGSANGQGKDAELEGTRGQGEEGVDEPE